MRWSRTRSTPAVGLVFALAKAPAIDRQRHQSFFRAHRRVGRLGGGASEQLLLAQVVHAAVPVNEEQTGRRRLPAVRDEEQRRDRLNAVQIELQPLERISLALLG